MVICQCRSGKVYGMCVWVLSSYRAEQNNMESHSIISRHSCGTQAMDLYAECQHQWPPPHYNELSTKLCTGMNLHIIENCPYWSWRSVCECQTESTLKNITTGSGDTRYADTTGSGCTVVPLNSELASTLQTNQFELQPGTFFILEANAELAMS